MSQLTDTSPMPNGEFKNTPMQEVPAWHPMWIYDNNKCRDDVRAYIDDNFDELLDELKDSRK